MRTRRVAVLFVTVLFVLLAMTLCACGGSNGGGSSGTTNPGTKDQSDVGWKNADSSQIYTALILGCTNVAYEGSKKAIADKNGILTVNSKIKVFMADKTLWLTILAKYDQNNVRERTMVSIDLSSAERATDETRIVSANVYKDELYLAVGSENKLKFPLENIAWTNQFPYEMEQKKSTDIALYSNMLTSAIVLNKANTAQYRRSDEGDEYHYTMDIALDKTLDGIFETAGKARQNAESLDKIKKFIAVFFGVDENDIGKGKLPEGKLLIDFYTTDGKISKLTFDFDIDMTEKTKLFDDGTMKGNASVEKLTLGKNYSAVSIPFVNDTEEQEKYVAFGDTLFTLDIPLTEYENGSEVPDSSILKITTKIFQGAGEDDLVFAEYIDAKTQKLMRGIYVYDNISYFYALNGDDYECLCAFDIDDLGELATKVLRNDLNGESAFDLTKALAYVINSAIIEGNAIKVSIKPNFFTDVWYNFEDLCTFVNGYTAVDLMQVDGISDFYNYVKNNEIIITFDTHIAFLKVVDSSDDTYVASVVARLNDVTEDKYLSSSED